jgi:hypothetical protein
MRPGNILSKNIVASMLAMLMYVPATSQTAQTSQRVRLLSREQGEAVVQVAWELRKGLDSKPDCSHFVHAIYQRAGLDYEYAPTDDIYQGIDSFRRVERAQVGDLVVWPGHVGIVIDPDEHTFYSSVISGFAIEDYRSEYWAGRGHPRFYRYLMNAAHSARLQAHLDIARTSQPISAGGHARRSHPAISGDGPDGKTPPTEATNGSAPADTEVSDLVFVSSQARPSSTEIHAALIGSATARADKALAHALLDSHRVLVADEFTVMEVKIQGRSGWADLEVREAATIQHGRAELKRATERWRVNLRREAQGWEMIAPSDKTCLTRDVAVQTLAAHVARISRTPANTEELKTAVKVLDDLLASEPAYIRVSDRK